MTDKSQTLRELVAMIEGVVRAGDDEDMPAEVIADTLEGLNWNLTEKTDAIAEFIRSCDAKASECREEAKRLSARARSWEGKKERVRAYTGFWLAKLNHSKIDTTLNSLSLAKGPDSVEITDENAIPMTFMVVTTKPDKLALQAALRRGDEIPGCHLEEGKPVVRLA